MPPTCFFERQTLVLSHLMRIRLGVAVLILLCKAVEANVRATNNVQFCLLKQRSTEPVKTKIYRTFDQVQILYAMLPLSACTLTQTKILGNL